MDDQASVHYRVWTLMPDGSRRLSQEIWRAGGTERIERGGGREVIVQRDGKRFVYDQDAKSILAYVDDPKTRRRESFNGTDLLREISSTGWLDSIHTVDAGSETVTSVVMRAERTRLRLWVNKATDLPTRVEIQSPKRGGWDTVQEGAFEFSRTTRDEGTIGNLPKGVPVVNVDEARAAYEAAWRAPRFRYGSTRIYDVEANEKGDVFVVYSGGNIRLEADGRTYTTSAVSDEFQPTEHWLNSDRVDGLTSPYGDLRGKIFTPVAPHEWRPLSLRIICAHPQSQTFNASQGHRYTGPDGKEYVEWSPEDMARAQAENERTAPDRAARTYAVRIASPDCAIAPSYMALIPVAIRSDAELAHSDATSLARYYMAAGQYAEAERALRAEIRAFDLMCLDYGSPGVQPEAYMDLYDVLAAEGKHDEAIQALRAVPDQMVYRNDGLQRRLDAAMAKEHLP